MVIANEFSHIVKLSEIGGNGHVRLSASEEARAALAKRFDLALLDMLEADLTLRQGAKGIEASGRMSAELAQICVASGEPLPVMLDEPIHIRFIPEPHLAADSETELESQDCDTMFHDGQSIDLGEAVAQSLGLALDPYPRSAEAEQILKAAGVKSEDEAAPMGALSSLKDLLAKK
ncbi:MAG TPA: DUF177 domain-containing protein [Sphingorhabdus sp.]|jgi:uncharacterized metal-binding protein YceD (DUF177 family)|nr:DUF177 domain-containing protein [Sphingorhabdus sp.]